MGADRGSCEYVIADVFPVVDGPHFEHRVGAFAGCWIAQPVSSADVEAMIVSKLLVDGWDVGRIMEREFVSSANYVDHEDGRAEFEQALIDGFVANVNCRARETMLLDDSEGPIPMRQQTAACYREFIGRLRDGAYSLIGDEQWANGVSPDGDDFFPLWSSEREMQQWLPRWPGYRPRRISLADLIGPREFLEGIANAELWVGACMNGALVTTHPLRILRDLR